MFGFQFVNYSTRILHSKDLDDMRTAILSDDDEVGSIESRPEINQKEDRIIYLPDRG